MAVCRMLAPGLFRAPVGALVSRCQVGVSQASRHEHSDGHPEQPRCQHPADGHPDLDRSGSAGERFRVPSPRSRFEYSADGATSAWSGTLNAAQSDTILWNTTGVTDGVCRLHVVVRDVAGNTTTSAAVPNVRIDNTVPTKRVRTTSTSYSERPRRSPARQPTRVRASTTSTSSAPRRAAGRGRRSPRTRLRSTGSRPASTRRP